MYMTLLSQFCAFLVWKYDNKVDVQFVVTFSLPTKGEKCDDKLKCWSCWSIRNSFWVGSFTLPCVSFFDFEELNQFHWVNMHQTGGYFRIWFSWKWFGAHIPGMDPVFLIWRIIPHSQFFVTSLQRPVKKEIQVQCVCVCVCVCVIHKSPSNHQKSDMLSFSWIHYLTELANLCLLFSS